MVNEAKQEARIGIKVRLTLGPALIDLEATLEEIVVVVTRLTQEFGKAAILIDTKQEKQLIRRGASRVRALPPTE